ncbi:uncharacterized protein METZ01_LOCUS124651, partial [marine metagenome]
TSSALSVRTEIRIGHGRTRRTPPTRKVLSAAGSIPGL